MVHKNSIVLVFVSRGVTYTIKVYMTCMTSCTKRYVALPHTAVFIFKMSGTMYINLNIVIT